MELLQTFLDEIPGYLDTATQFIGAMSWTSKIAVIIGPLLIAVFSRHFVSVLAVLLLSAMTLAILAAPQFMTTVMILGAFAGALLFALAGFSLRRKRKAVQAELEALKVSVAELSDAEQRRLVVQLKSPGKADGTE